ncbi:uncharacterized protein LOC125378532 [Haliotis rufescens]|uniref:uncharacterized protein LOC125378532 n=1 Tax=Haliotis rufescens TaxID=6454 RepID=UPI00201F3EC3|nr:uncharacterized protein LOC125378532 [Haliotis rufescens]
MVPVEEVDDVWLQTIADMPNDQRCVQLEDVTTTSVETEKEPLNHFNNDRPRTNNHLEGWHGRLKKVIGKAHPNIFELISFLGAEQQKTECNLLQYQAGQRLPPEKKKFCDIQCRIDQLKTRPIQNEVSVIFFSSSQTVLIAHDFCESLYVRHLVHIHSNYL